MGKRTREESPAKRPGAFVLMPFSQAASKTGSYPALSKDDLDTVYSVISTCLENLGYRVSRSDSPGPILRDIVHELDRADLVVADLTSLNPNVMYELGIRHGFCKPTILLTQDLDELPFDLRGHQCVRYRWVTNKDRDQLKQDVTHELEKIASHEDPRFGPVHLYLGAKLQGVLDYERRSVVRQLRSLMEEIAWASAGILMRFEKLAEEFPEVFAVDLTERKLRIDKSKLSSEMRKRSEDRLSMNLDLPAIDHLLATAYIPEVFDQFGEVAHFMDLLRGFRNFTFYAGGMGDYNLGTAFALGQGLTIMATQLVQAVERNWVGKRVFEIKVDLDEPMEQSKGAKNVKREAAALQGHSHNPDAAPDDNRAKRGRRR